MQAAKLAAARRPVLFAAVPGALVLAAGLLAAGLSAPAARAAGRAVPAFSTGWKQAPANAGLSGVSCPNGSDCVAVGSYTDALGHQRSAAQVWNGHQWTVLGGVPGAGLSAVSCPRRSFCMAVGSIAARWSGKAWRPLKVPAVGGSAPALSGVWCTSGSFCMAVGTAGGTQNVALAWNGSAWRSLAVPGNLCGPFCGLDSVACPSAKDCVAVGAVGNDAGTEDYTEGMDWNGKAWRETATPAPYISSNLAGVSCAGGANCIAVGSFQSEVPACNCMLAASWDGTGWTQLSTPPVGPGLSGVSCPAAGDCVAVGGTLAMTWDGGTWTQRPVVAPGEAGTSLSGVSCWASSACMAVGSYTESSGARLTLAERWNGTTWTVERTRSPGDFFAGLSGVSCPYSFACVAVGTTITSADGYGALAERWNGHRWGVMLARSPGAQVSVLSSVSCPNAHYCMAVGHYDVAGMPQALAEQWTGASWQVLPIGQAGTLNSVSCPATGGCVAVGSYFGAHGHRFAMAESWNGAAWQAQSTPEPGATITQLSGVWCNSMTNCTAVGTSNTSLTSPLNPLTERWNGSTWQVRANPGGSRQLGAISCPGPTHCVAVGSDLVGYGRHLPSGTVSMLRSAAVWTVVGGANPGGQDRAARLDGVSCVLRFRCQGVGGFQTGSGGTGALAESWNGTRWQLEPVPVPGPAFDELFGVSCATATDCIAVGVTGAQQALAEQWNGAAWQLMQITP